MANEITISGTLKIVQSGLTEELTKVSKTITMVGAAKDAHSESYTTTAALVVIAADVIAEGVGWVEVLNPDATNNLLLSFDNGATYPFSIFPGESFGPVRLNVAPTVNPNIKIKTSASTITGVPMLFTGR